MNGSKNAIRMHDKLFWQTTYNIITTTATKIIMTDRFHDHIKIDHITFEDRDATQFMREIIKNDFPHEQLSIQFTSAVK